MTRAFRIGQLIATIYWVVGLALGSFLYLALPAVNALGLLFYAATWPIWVSAGCFHTSVIPIPAWCYSFRSS